jgi:5-oxoprolinase (ATP-hydrolysing) subunit A
MPVIDLNSDIGEGYGAWPGGPDAELAPHITSANIACGFHAGDPSTIRATCELAVRHACAIGAQVSYPDLVGFGRRFIDMQSSELTDAIVYQLGALQAFAHLAGSRVRYVKPHGALYNAIVHHHAQAKAVATAIAEYDSTLPVLGLPGSAITDACAHAGVPFVVEGFADRAYTAEGTLVPRTQPGALITDPVHAADQALELAARGVASICIHSDTPGAPQLLAAVRRALGAAGYTVQPFAP